MVTPNELVYLAFKGQTKVISQHLESNIDINCRASFEGVYRKGCFESSYPSFTRLNKVGAFNNSHKEGYGLNYLVKAFLNQYTPLQAAILGGRPQTVSLLLQNGARIDMTCVIYNEKNLYHSAGIKYAIDCMGNVTPLLLALMCGNLEVIKTLVEKAQDRVAINLEIERCLGAGEGAMFVAPYRLNDLKIFTFLIEKYFTKHENLKKFFDNQPIVYVYNTASFYSRAFMQIAFSHAIKIFGKDAVAKCFHESDFKKSMARVNRKKKSAQVKLFNFDLLIKLGILSTPEEIDFQDENGHTFLHCAIVSQDLDNIKVLLKAGASLQKNSNQGNTALHIALIQPQCNPKIIETLINYGAPGDVKNNEGKIPSDLCKNPTALFKLLENYAKSKERPVTKKVPLAWKWSRNNEKVVNSVVEQNVLKSLPQAPARIFSSSAEQEEAKQSEKQALLAS